MGHMVFPWLVPDDPASFASFQAQHQLITHISPTWYSMTADLKIASRAAPQVAEWAREVHIPVHPLIANRGFDADIAHAILATPETRAHAAQAIANLVFEEGFDGINMDFEGTFGRSRDHYTDLLRRLGELLHPHDKWVTVDVVSQTKHFSAYPEESWASPFDYAALGEICDRVMLMGYDYSMATPGPVSPGWWLDEVVDWTMSQMPAEKVVLGLPFYCRHWIIKDGQISRPYGPKQDECAQLVKQSGKQPEYLQQEATSRVIWTDEQGEHHVYYDDASTLRQKMCGARHKGVQGFAFWRLGQESADVWQAVADCK